MRCGCAREGSIGCVSGAGRGQERIKEGEKMRQVDIYDQGELVLVEMEVFHRELKGNDIKYKLKMPGKEDYLEQEYSFDKLIPVKDKGSEADD